MNGFNQTASYNIKNAIKFTFKIKIHSFFFFNFHKVLAYNNKNNNNNRFACF